MKLKDNNGSIENEELRGFLKDLLELVKKVSENTLIFLCILCADLFIYFRIIFQDYDAQDLLDFEETILQGVDYNDDGKINRKELTMILLALAKHNQEDETNSV